MTIPSAARLNEMHKTNESNDEQVCTNDNNDHINVITYFLIYSSSTDQSYPKTMAAPLASILGPPKAALGRYLL